MLPAAVPVGSPVEENETGWELPLISVAIIVLLADMLPEVGCAREISPELLKLKPKGTGFVIASWNVVVADEPRRFVATTVMGEFPWVADVVTVTTFDFVHGGVQLPSDWTFTPRGSPGSVKYTCSEIPPKSPTEIVFVAVALPYVGSATEIFPEFVSERPSGT